MATIQRCNALIYLVLKLCDCNTSLNRSQQNRSSTQSLVSALLEGIVRFGASPPLPPARLEVGLRLARHSRQGAHEDGSASAGQGCGLGSPAQGSFILANR